MAYKHHVFSARMRAPLSYAVIYCSGSWRVLTPQRQFGYFRRLESAWEVVVSLAREAEASGQRVELLQQRDEADSVLNFVYQSPSLRDESAR